MLLSQTICPIILCSRTVVRQLLFSFSWQAVRAVAEEQSVHFDDWQREIEPEEVEHLEEERLVAGDGLPEVAVGSAPKGKGRAAVRRDVKKRGKAKDDQRRADMGLPFLTGISPAGFLSATRKQPGERDHAIKVNE